MTDSRRLLVSRWYELRLMDLLGYQPELRACVSCGENLDRLGSA